MTIRGRVRKSLEKTLAELDLPVPEKLSLEEPKNPEHGDLATNAALLLAKTAKRPPKELAESLMPALARNCDLVARIDFAHPGFCNIVLKPEAWHSVINEVEKAGGAFGRSESGAGRKALVEYVSANPTGPLHVGHGRGAAVGDSVARILRAAGYEVATEYYLNDAGRQMRLLGLSIWLRLLEASGLEVEFPKDCYKGDYIRELAVQLLASRPDLPQLPEREALEICQKYGMETILADIREDMARFRCEHQRFFSEKSLVDSGLVQKAFDSLAVGGRIHEKEGALWFDSPSLAGEQDRVLRKSDGTLTYFATDIAYHHDKFERGFTWLIDVWGADHHGYIPRMKAAIADMGHDPDKFSVLLIQLVNLLNNGELVSMSTRAGEFITLKQLLDEVGVDAARFLFLSRSCDTPLDFDLEVARSRSMDNPVYYAQYAHARVCSLLRRAEDRGITVPEHTDPALFALLTDGGEVAISRLLDDWENVVAAAASNLAPHFVARYVTTLAERIHSYYSRQNILGQEDGRLILARLALLRAAAQVLRNALFLLGVKAPEAM